MGGRVAHEGSRGVSQFRHDARHLPYMIYSTHWHAWPTHVSHVSTVMARSVHVMLRATSGNPTSWAIHMSTERNSQLPATPPGPPNLISDALARLRQHLRHMRKGQTLLIRRFVAWSLSVPSRLRQGQGLQSLAGAGLFEFLLCDIGTMAGGLVKPSLPPRQTQTAAACLKH